MGSRKGPCDEAAEAVEVNEVGEFEAVTEGSAGGENRIPAGATRHSYAESTALAKPLRGRIT